MGKKREVFLLSIMVLLVINILGFLLIYSIKMPSLHTLTGEVTTVGNVSICLVRPPAITAIPDQEATSGQEFTYQVGTTFYGANTSTSFLDNTTLFAINGSGYISFTPAAADVGSHSILITAQDTSGCLGINSTDDFILTVAAGAGGGGGAAAGGGGGGGGGTTVAEKRAENIPLPFSREPQNAGIEEGSRVTFAFAGEQHAITVWSVQGNQATLIISSPPIILTMEEGESRRVDLDEDGKEDLFLKLTAIRKKKVFFTFNSLRQGFTLSDTLLKINVKQSQRAEKSLSLSSDWPKTLKVSAENPLPEIVELLPPQVELAREPQPVTIIINPQQNLIPGIYTGNLLFTAVQDTDYFEKSLRLVIEAESEKSLYDASVDLLKKAVAPGEPLEAVITIFSVAYLPSTPITLVYGISDLQNHNLFTAEETITIDQQASLSKKFPLSWPAGEYLFWVKVQTIRAEQEQVATASELFTVQAAPSALAGLAAPLLRYAYAPAIILFIGAFAVAAFIAAYAIHRRTRKIPAILHRMEAARARKAPSGPTTERVSELRWSELRRKRAALEDGYRQGYITADAYRKAKSYLEQQLGQGR